MTSSLILDFDGVFTTNKIHEDITTLCMEELSELSEKPFEKVKKDFEKVKEDVLNRPQHYGWVSNNILSGYADEDPFALIFGILHRLFETDYRQAILKRYEVPESVQYNNYKKIYSKEKVIVNKNTSLVLEELSSSFDKVTIVTNSDTEKVKEFIDNFNTEIPIIGHAKKFLIDNTFQEVPESFRVESRTIALRRPLYYETLQELKADKNIVVGDVFSMDLALPYHLGFDIVLKENDYTPLWSKEFVKNNGLVIKDLQELSNI